METEQHHAHCLKRTILSKNLQSCELAKDFTINDESVGATINNYSDRCVPLANELPLVGKSAGEAR